MKRRLSVLLVVALMAFVSVIALNACNRDVESITPQGYRTRYFIGDTEIDRSVGSLVVVEDNGNTYTVPFTDTAITFSGFNTGTAVESQTITATYRGASTTFIISIEADSAEGITLQNHRTTYFTSDTSADLEGEVVLGFVSGRTEVVSFSDPGVVITGYNFGVVITEPVTQTVHVSYGGFSAQFNITVRNRTATAIAVNNLRTTQAQGATEFDRARATISASYDDGRTVVFPLSDARFNITGFNAAALGAQTITIAYGAVSTTANITVAGGNTPREVRAGINTYSNRFLPPRLQGIVIDTNTIQIRIDYADNTHRIVSFNATDFTFDFDDMNIGATNIYVGYQGAYAVMMVTISENYVLTFNRYIAAMGAATTPQNATAAQIAAAAEAIRVFRTDLAYDRTASNAAGSINEADLIRAVRIVFEQSYAAAQEVFEEVSGRVFRNWNEENNQFVISMSLGQKDVILSWLDGARILLEALDSLTAIMSPEFDSIEHNGEPVTDLIEDLMSWNGLFSNNTQIFIELIDRALGVYDRFDGIRLDTQEDVLIPSTTILIQETMDYLMENDFGVPFMFTALGHWRPAIYDAMIWSFYQRGQYDHADMLAIAHTPFLFNAAREAGWIAIRTMAGQQDMIDSTEFLMFHNRFITLVNELKQSNHWYHKYVAFYYAININTGITLGIDGQPTLLHVTIEQAVEMVNTSQFRAYYVADGQIRFRYVMGLRPDWRPAFEARIRTFSNPNFDIILNMYLDLIERFGRFTTEDDIDADGNWIFNIESLKDAEFGIAVDAFMRAFVNLPAIYIYNFFSALDLRDGGVRGNNITNNQITSWMFEELDHFLFFLAVHYENVIGDNVPAMVLFETMLRALEMYMFVGVGVAQHQAFVSFMDTRVIVEWNALTNRTATEQHLGFFFQRLYALRAISMQIIADTYAPTVDAYWEAVFNRLTRYLNAFDEGFRRHMVGQGVTVPNLARRDMWTPMMTAAARIRAVHTYIMQNAPQNIIDVYTHHARYQLIRPPTGSHALFTEVDWALRNANLVVDLNINTLGAGLRVGLGSNWLSETHWELWYDMFDLAWAYLTEMAYGTAHPIAWSNLALEDISLNTVIDLMQRIHNLPLLERLAFVVIDEIVIGGSIVGDHHLFIEAFFEEYFGANSAMLNFIIVLNSMEYLRLLYSLNDSAVNRDLFLGENGIVLLLQRYEALGGNVDARLSAKVAYLYDMAVEMTAS